jgi:hypothetical protein
MVEDEGEHTLAAADEEALDATKQEELRARRDSPALVVVVGSVRQTEREPLVTNKIKGVNKESPDQSVARCGVTRAWYGGHEGGGRLVYD